MIDTVTLEGFVTQVPDENGLMMMEYLPYRLNFSPGQRKQTQTVYVDVRKMPVNMRAMIGRKARVVVHGGIAGCAQEDDPDDLYLGPHIRAVRVVVCDEPSGISIQRVVHALVGAGFDHDEVMEALKDIPNEGKG